MSSGVRGTRAEEEEGKKKEQEETGSSAKVNGQRGSSIPSVFLKLFFALPLGRDQAGVFVAIRLRCTETVDAI